MNEKPASSATKPARPGRDVRLKAALKANMARRKAQAKAREAGDAAGKVSGGGKTEDGHG